MVIDVESSGRKLVFCDICVFKSQYNLALALIFNLQFHTHHPRLALRLIKYFAESTSELSSQAAHINHFLLSSPRLDESGTNRGI